MILFQSAVRKLAMHADYIYSDLTQKHKGNIYICGKAIEWLQSLKKKYFLILLKQVSYVKFSDLVLEISDIRMQGITIREEILFDHFFLFHH